jgi:hypothetical protein
MSGLLILTSCLAGQPGDALPEKAATSEKAPPTSTPEATSTRTPTLTPSPTASPSPTPKPTLVLQDEFMQGIGIGRLNKGSFLLPNTAWTFENIMIPMGANWIAITANCTKATHATTEITCDRDPISPAKADFPHVVNTAHDLGLRVFMQFTIHIDAPKSSKHRIGEGYSEEEWNTWFKNYTDAVTDYAAIAEELDVDLFSIGEEIDNTLHREEGWRQVAAAVREVYHGPITYSALEEEDYLGVTWWDAVDYIGVHPHGWELSRRRDASVEEMVANIEDNVARLEALSERFDRPVVLSEVMYSSIDGISRSSSHRQELFPYTTDLQEQADCYRVIFEAFEGKEWLKGIFWFHITPGWLERPPNNPLVMPVGKPAENVVREYYGASLKPAPTVIPTPDHEESEVEWIYQDDFMNGWKNYSPNGDLSAVVNLSGSEERKVIKLTLRPWGKLILGRLPEPGEDTLDLSQYQYLEFDMWVEKTSTLADAWPYAYPVTIKASILTLYGQSASPFMVDASSPTYLDSEEFQAKTWHHVTVPMAEFGPILSPAGTIRLRYPGAGSMPLDVYFDNIRLIKGP